MVTVRESWATTEQVINAYADLKPKAKKKGKHLYIRHHKGNWEIVELNPFERLGRWLGLTHQRSTRASVARRILASDPLPKRELIDKLYDFHVLRKIDKGVKEASSVEIPVRKAPEGTRENDQITYPASTPDCDLSPRGHLQLVAI
ncbi:MAG: hypothetical protein AB7F31_06735 [Parachlamydiales bacterium]